MPGTGRSRTVVYRAIWRDPDVARELRSRLEASGAWAVAETLVRD